MDELSQEIAAFEAMKPTLEADKIGKWALVRGRDLIDVFDDFDAAAREAIKQFGRGPYLIRQIGAPPVILPASVMYVFNHA